MIFFFLELNLNILYYYTSVWSTVTVLDLLYRCFNSHLPYLDIVQLPDQTLLHQVHHLVLSDPLLPQSQAFVRHPGRLAGLAVGLLQLGLDLNMEVSAGQCRSVQVSAGQYRSVQVSAGQCRSVCSTVYLGQGVFLLLPAAELVLHLLRPEHRLLCSAVVFSIQLTYQPLHSPAHQFFLSVYDQLFPAWPTLQKSLSRSSSQLQLSSWQIFGILCPHWN